MTLYKIAVWIHVTRGQQQGKKTLEKGEGYLLQVLAAQVMEVRKYIHISCILGLVMDCVALTKYM
jgi:hypothetical protein